MIEHFLLSSNLKDPEDIDSLLEFASLIRELISGSQSEPIKSLIRYTLENSYYEAFSWCMEILQEALEQEPCELRNFECVLGKFIPDYDEFIERLQVDFKVYSNGFETVCDHNGEVESFYNILIYPTKYRNIHLVSSENFDTKDNDYVQYKLSFARN